VFAQVGQSICPHRPSLTGLADPLRLFSEEINFPSANGVRHVFGEGLISSRIPTMLSSSAVALWMFFLDTGLTFDVPMVA